MSALIEDYAIIGDRETAALVCRSGSIDWLCLPRFDSGACFAALLGTRENGRWLIAPSSKEVSVKRSYLENTLVLETVFSTPSGVAVLTDFMPARDACANVVRIVEGRSGTVRMHMELIMRFDYGSIVPWVERLSDPDFPGEAIRALAGPDSVVLRSSVPLTNRDFVTHAEFDVGEGQNFAFELTWHPSHEEPPRAFDPFVSYENTVSWWREWCSRCTYSGEWREQVMRSLITLKALTYAPTGGIVAAATTSLPEEIGGVRNWDYRMCWLRDSTFTLYALLQAGYREEAAAWRAWLRRAVAGDPRSTHIMYGLGGERRLPELELDWLPGYEGSRPVRTGNEAVKQFQLDVFGEVLDTMFQARKLGLDLQRGGWGLEFALVDFVEKVWEQPDEGIWEVRSGRRHFTHSKIMAWVAVDRAIAAVEQLQVPGPVERWRDLRSRIHRDVCERGFDAERNSFVQSYGSKEVDASLLTIPLVGFLPAHDPRFKGTVAAIEHDLMRDGLILRYDSHKSDDGLPPGEGVFLACSFWYADALYMMGRRDEARAVFSHLLSICNDVGLLAEEYDPKAKRQLGNFPQAFSHIGLVVTAMNLSPGEHHPAEERPDQHAEKQQRK
jgi:GH15 family glucan-1,4-alpha-glucosidase